MAEGRPRLKEQQKNLPIRSTNLHGDEESNSKIKGNKIN